MRRPIIVLLASASLMTPAAAASQGSPAGAFCDRLRRIVDAAYEQPAFRSLDSNAAETRRFMQDCTLSGSGDYRRLVCESRVAPTSDAWLELNADIVRCYPRAIQMAEPDDGRRFARFRFDIIAIHTAQRNYGMRGGSFVSYTVMRLPVH